MRMRRPPSNLDFFAKELCRPGALRARAFGGEWWGAIAFVGVFLAATLVWALPSLGQAKRSRGEAEIKSAYLLKFLEYVTWPSDSFDDSTSPLVIGIFKDGMVGESLKRLAPQARAKRRKILVREFKSIEDYRACHVLFVPKSSGAELQTKAIARTKKLPVLVVGEKNGFASAGGSVNFYIDVDRTVGFEINPDAAASHRLRIHASLLRLARVVRSKSPPRKG